MKSEELCTAIDASSLRYKGYYYDPGTGFYYLQSRYYDPKVGRFISADWPDVLTVAPTALTDKNLYAYCDNNPIMRTDEDGEAWNVLAGALIGGLVNLVTSAASETINYFSAEKSDRLSMGQIAAIVGVSTAIGAAEGAAIAAVPSAAIPISAAAGAAEAAITSLISRNEKTSGKDILTDTIIAGALGAAAGGGGSDFVKGGKVLNEARIGSITKATKGVSMKAKKTARHAIRKAKKYVAKSWMCSQLESFAYAGMNKFSTWFTEKWIDGISGR